MQPDLNISLIQSNLIWESASQNRQLFEEKILSISQPTDLIILPEMFSTGFSMNASQLAEPMNGDTMKWLHNMAHKANAVVTGSIITVENKKYYNRLIWMQPDGSYSHYDKRHLFSLANEQETFNSGNEQLILSLKGWKIFPLICYDLRFPVWSRRNKNLEYDLLIYVANWPQKRIKAWNKLLVARAIENQCYVAGINRLGEDGNTINYTGESLVLDFAGETLSNFKLNEEKIETIVLDKSKLSEYRKQFPFGEDGDEFEIRY